MKGSGLEGQRREGPARLVAGGGRLAEGLRRLAETTADGGAPEQAWERVAARLRQPSPRRWPALLAAAAATAAIAFGLLHATPSRETKPTAPTQPGAHGPSPEVQRFALVTGEQQWPGGWARLGDGGAGSVEISPRGTRVVLERGALAMRLYDVPATDPAYVVEVRSTKYVTRGAIFRLIPGANTQLAVEAGQVIVEQDGRKTVVDAGQHWPVLPTVSSPAVAPRRAGHGPRRRIASPEDRPSPAEAPAPAEPVPSCAAMAQVGRHDEALRCYRQQGTGTGLAAEAALYEMGRIRRDRLGDAAGALESFETCRQRFPRGALRYEVDLSVLELEARLGRHPEALAESARLLETHPRGERAGEIHLLRGNILRERLHDCGAAEREYAAAATTRGRIGDDAAFFRAGCLELLGRRDAAREAYRELLRRDSPRHRAEAQQRLDALEGR